jgi:hypothetical protein
VDACAADEHSGAADGNQYIVADINQHASANSD